MIHALFIGIDRHQDPTIRELTGARRDALALWALFSDTIPDIQAEVLLDSDATLASVRASLKRVLETSAVGDTVILSFSGHGTRDHRFVVHDTDSAALGGSTLPMAELARYFKDCKAGRVLCILDCCFSGGAPARVLDSSPIPRDPGMPLAELGGKGRLLLAASNTDEPAYELPTGRNGLLTRALLDILQEGTGALSLPAILDDVMARVRAHAGRLGVVQTPVLFGHVEGGLTLPALRPGLRFFQAFPEAKGAQISGKFDDLRAFGFPDSILLEWKDRFASGLNALQVSAVNDHRILEGHSLLVVAPTSAGKTFVGELAAVRAYNEGRKTVVLLPYRALVNEKFDDFNALYGERLGLRVLHCTGDHLDQTGDFVRGRYDIGILTYEMFLSLVLGNPTLLNQVGLVVLDEGQFITDPNRGIVVELILTNLLSAKSRDITPQLLVLSATIGDVNRFNEWLGCELLLTRERPVPLIEGVLDRRGFYRAIAPDGRDASSQLLPATSIVQRRTEASAQDVIVPLARALVEKGEKVLVFRNKRGSTKGAARYLAEELHLLAADGVIDQLPTQDLSTTSADLRDCLKGGTAFHNTNLTREERVVVERAFRDPDGPVRILVSTTTLAAGINTPASTVILVEHEFVGAETRSFTVAEYKNMAGRAGRVGFREEGKAILLADNSIDRDRLFAKYSTGQPEPARSSFGRDELDTWIVRLLAQVKEIPRTEVVRLLVNTYGGYLAARENPDWHGRTVVEIEGLLTKMLSMGLLEQEDVFVRLTPLGQVCGRSSLRFRSALRLVSFLEQVSTETLSASALMAIVQGLEELDSCYTPLMRKGPRDSAWPREAAGVYGHRIVSGLQRNAGDITVYNARCKRACILAAWTSGIATQEIERRYTTNPFVAVGYGDIRAMADATRFHLRSAYEIASLKLIERSPSAEEMESLLRQLELGIPVSALPLLEARITLTRGEYLALVENQVTSLAALRGIEEKELAAMLGIQRARELARIRSQALGARD